MAQQVMRRRRASRDLFEEIFSLCFYSDELHSGFIRSRPFEHEAVASSIQNSLRPIRPVRRNPPRAARPKLSQPPTIRLPCKRNNEGEIRTRPGLGLGPLSLPIELLFMVLDMLDLQSLFRFRHVHSLASQRIADMLHYKTLTQCALPTLAFLLRTRTAQYVTLSDIYDALTTRTCRCCGYPTPYVFLSTFRRLCEYCIIHDHDVRLYDKRSVSTALRTVWDQRPLCVRNNDIPTVLEPVRTAISRLPTIQAPLGTFPGTQFPFKRHSTLLVDEDMEDLCHCLETQAQEDLLDDVLGEVSSHFESFSMRYRGSTALPYLDPKTQRLDRGVRCLGCDEVLVSRAERERKRHGAGFPSLEHEILHHFDRCKSARVKWLMHSVRRSLWRRTGEDPEEPD